MKHFMYLGLALSLTACGTAEKIANIGQAPDLAKIENPTTQSSYQPVSLPMPAPKNGNKQLNSLWEANKITFFQDQRAADVGDIITVLINIQDRAELDNETERRRNGSEGVNLPALVGLEAELGKVLPNAVNPNDLIRGDSNSTYRGEGTVEREERIEVQLAALITQVLPNGNLVVHGKQEVLVNYEKRVLQIDGVIRPEDITTANTISYEKIAEARIAYGGEGNLTDVQQARYGQQLYDIIFPF